MIKIKTKITVAKLLSILVIAITCLSCSGEKEEDGVVVGTDGNEGELTTSLGTTAYYQDVIGPAAQVADVQRLVPPSNPNFYVTNDAELSSAYASATSGQSIVVADGSYNFTPNRTNTGDPILVVSENVLGATLANIDVRNTPVSGLTIANFNAGTLRFSGQPHENIRLVGCNAAYIYFRDTVGDITIEHCVVDRNYDGQCMNLSYINAGVTIRNCIFARAGNENNHASGGSDNIQIQGFNGTLTFERNVVWGNRVIDNAGQHPDLLQINGIGIGIGVLVVRNNLFFEGYVDGVYKGAQGIFATKSGAGESYSAGSIVENNLVSPTGLSRHASFDSFNGAIRNNSIIGPIHSANKLDEGTSAGVQMEYNLVRQLQIETSDTLGTDIGNYVYGTNQSTVFSSDDGQSLGASWRHFIPLTDVGDAGAQEFLQELQDRWDN